MVTTHVSNCEKPRLVVTTTDEEGNKLDVKVLNVSKNVKEALLAGGMAQGE